MSTSLYRLLNVSKDYGERRVLEAVTLEIQTGEVLAIIGPSGAGKSTLLRLLNFLEPPSAGEIHFQRQVFSTNQDVPIGIRRKVTTVFQKPLLLDSSVWSNVHYGLWLRGQRDARGQVYTALEKVGLSAMAHQTARTLSGGEAQRVALARALIIQPEVLLLDEPTANLDPYNVNLIEDIIRATTAEQKLTTVIVTHNIFQAKRVADRVALILDGKIIEIANVERFFESPTDPRTAAFTRGDMVY
jgi:tungstate transport system ATP-binding protein